MNETIDESVKQGASKIKTYGLIAGGVVLAGAVAIGLIALARGASYPLTVVDPSLGSENAPVLIEEFADWQCPACRLAAVAVEEVAKTYPTQVRIVYKDFPIPGHTHARFVAAAALCAAQQNKFSEFYKKTFETQTQWTGMDRAGVETVLVTWATDEKLDMAAFNTCRESRTVRAEIDKDVKEGLSRSVNSTPTFFIDGQKQEGGLSVFQWIQKINEVLKSKGLEPESGTAPTTASE